MVGTARRRAFRHAVAAPGANTSFLSSAITPTKDASKLRIFIVLATGSVFNAYITDGTTPYTVALNGGVALTAGVAYTIDLPCSPRCSYQLRVATDGIIQQVIVDEIVGS